MAEDYNHMALWRDDDLERTLKLTARRLEMARDQVAAEEKAMAILLAEQDRRKAAEP